MGDTSLKCPFCCDKTFISKVELIEHLATVFGNVSCPICHNKWSSIGHLIEHLTLDNCHSDNTTKNLKSSEVGINDDISNGNSNSEPDHSTNIDVQNTVTDPFTIEKETIEDGSEVGKMYVELLSKQQTKPCLQQQELKLVKEHGVSRYMIVTNEDSKIDPENETVVTKQNNDGTISLTTVKEMKLESDTVITQENENEANQEEVYSCNTCGVSFTSVLDHIQNYHNDQDVVVEEPLEDSVDDSLPIELSDPLDEDDLGDKQPSRRVITDTGNIVEAPVILRNGTICLGQSNTTKIEDEKEEVVDKLGRPNTRQYNTRRHSQVEMLCDSVIRDIKKPDEKNGPYHKVVVKEMQSTDGQKVKVYYCMSCNIYVASLDDFKLHPCTQFVAAKYTCPHCPVVYENSKSLCAHMKVHKAKTPGPDLCLVPATFTCEVCKTIFPTHKSLKLHKRMHDPIKSRPIEPAAGNKFLCTVCNKRIPVEYLVVHQNSHNDAETFNCDICNKKFQSNDYLEMHMSVHSVDKIVVSKQDQSLPYTCLYCDRRFARPHEKVKHERIHTGEKPHSCEICGKSFRVSYCLTLHMRTHTGARPYACPVCGKRFKAHSVYNHHLQTHSDVRAYKCPYCPKAFKTAVQLAGHKNSHTKPFSCQHCNRPFASLYAVRVHTETHARQNNLKFSCTLCGASYARAFALKDHVKQVHKQDVDHKEALGLKDDWMPKSGIAEADMVTIEIGKDIVELS